MSATSSVGPQDTQYTAPTVSEGPDDGSDHEGSQRKKQRTDTGSATMSSKILATEKMRNSNQSLIGETRRLAADMEGVTDVTAEEYHQKFRGLINELGQRLSEALMENTTALENARKVNKFNSGSKVTSPVTTLEEAQSLDLKERLKARDQYLEETREDWEKLSLNKDDVEPVMHPKNGSLSGHGWQADGLCTRQGDFYPNPNCDTLEDARRLMGFRFEQASAPSEFFEDQRSKNTGTRSQTNVSQFGQFMRLLSSVAPMGSTSMGPNAIGLLSMLLDNPVQTFGARSESPTDSESMPDAPSPNQEPGQSPATGENAGP